MAIDCVKLFRSHRFKFKKLRTIENMHNLHTFNNPQKIKMAPRKGFEPSPGQQPAAAGILPAKCHLGI